MVDEAYYHFFGETVMGDVGKVPNLLVARTFSKAYGLANLRIGMLAGNRGVDEVRAQGELAVQREWRGAGLPAGGAEG
jgi:histidinol-phosphate/aromatic aminotransferase/cobyric acid decarboxylase-like protein